MSLDKPRLSESMDLQAWINDEATTQDDALYAKRAGVNQAIFVRDPVAFVFNRHRKEDEPKITAQVVSWHNSKSVKLPVYYIDARAALGVEIRMRGNFHNWMVSVSSERPIPDVFFTLFKRDKIVHEVYCEGFIADWVFGSYEDDPSEFTIELPWTDEPIWAFFFLMVESLRQEIS